jgi:hypothetical protein
MKGYVILADPGRHEGRVLTRWIGRSLDFALSLPPKAKAKREGNKRAAKSDAGG